jgi:hypothetical protein
MSFKSINQLFGALSQGEASDLHQRIRAGRIDSETRAILRRAMRLARIGAMSRTT